MPDPEIDRRCISCGASIRPQAVFCPQCGQNVEKPSSAETAESDKTSSNFSAQRDTIAVSGSTVADLSETQPLTALPDFSETQPLTQIPDHSETQPLSSFAAVPTVPKPTTPQPFKPTSQSRDGNIKSRVNKIRKASSVVIDQAAYDPSLRFILIAGVLFILFVILLIFSKVLG